MTTENEKQLAEVPRGMEIDNVHFTDLVSEEDRSVVDNWLGHLALLVAMNKEFQKSYLERSEHGDAWQETKIQKLHGVLFDIGIDEENPATTFITKHQFIEILSHYEIECSSKSIETPEEELAIIRDLDRKIKIRNAISGDNSSQLFYVEGNENIGGASISNEFVLARKDGDDWRLAPATRDNEEEIRIYEEDLVTAIANIPSINELITVPTIFRQIGKDLAQEEQQTVQASASTSQSKTQQQTTPLRSRRSDGRGGSSNLVIGSGRGPGDAAIPIPSDKLTSDDERDETQNPRRRQRDVSEDSADAQLQRELRAQFGDEQPINPDSSKTDERPRKRPRTAAAQHDSDGQGATYGADDDGMHLDVVPRDASEELAKEARLNEETGLIEIPKDATTILTVKPYAPAANEDELPLFSINDAVVKKLKEPQYSPNSNNILPWRSTSDISKVDDELADLELDPTGRTPYEIVSIEYEMDNADAKQYKKEIETDRTKGIEEGRYAEDQYPVSEIDDAVKEYKQEVQKNLNVIRDNANARRTGQTGKDLPTLETFEVEVVDDESKELHIAINGHDKALVVKTDFPLSAGIIAGASLVSMEDYFKRRDYYNGNGHSGDDFANVRKASFNVKLKHTDHAADDKPPTTNFSTLGALPTAACVGNAVKVVEKDGKLEFAEEDDINAMHTQGSAKITIRKNGRTKTIKRPVIDVAPLPHAKKGETLKVAAGGDNEGHTFVEWLNMQYDVKRNEETNALEVTKKPIIRVPAGGLKRWDDVKKATEDTVWLDSTFDQKADRLKGLAALNKFIAARNATYLKGQGKRKLIDHTAVNSRDPEQVVRLINAFLEKFKPFKSVDRETGETLTVTKTDAHHILKRMAEEVILNGDYKFRTKEGGVGLEPPKFVVSPKRQEDFMELKVELRRTAHEAEQAGRGSVDIDRLETAIKAVYGTMVAEGKGAPEPAKKLLTEKELGADADRPILGKILAQHKASKAYVNAGAASKQNQDLVMNMVEDIVKHRGQLQDRTLANTASQSKTQGKARAL